MWGRAAGAVVSVWGEKQLRGATLRGLCTAHSVECAAWVALRGATYCTYLAMHAAWLLAATVAALVPPPPAPPPRPPQEAYPVFWSVEGDDAAFAPGGAVDVAQYGIRPNNWSVCGGLSGGWPSLGEGRVPQNDCCAVCIAGPGTPTNVTVPANCSMGPAQPPCPTCSSCPTPCPNLTGYLSPIVNGGVPQAGNLSLHLAQLSDSVEKRIPDPDWAGLGIFDFGMARPLAHGLSRWPVFSHRMLCAAEEWVPSYYGNVASCGGHSSKYQNYSRQLVMAKHPTWAPERVEAQAKKEFEAAAVHWFVASLRRAAAMRPRALWGFYGLPAALSHRRGGWPALQAPTVLTETEALAWVKRLAPIWQASGAIFPSVYATSSFPRDVWIEQLVTVGVAAAAHGAGPAPLPVYPFISEWSAAEGFNALAPPAQLSAYIERPYSLGASGLVIWGSIGMPAYGKKGHTTEYYNFIRNTTGPMVRGFERRVAECSRRHCSGHGRCVTIGGESGGGCQCYDGYSGAHCKLDDDEAGPAGSATPSGYNDWCPCTGRYPDGRSLCEPLKPQPPPRREVIAYPGSFGLYGQFGSDWRQWDWSKVTTVALYSNLGNRQQGCHTREQGNCSSSATMTNYCCLDAELLCTAHAHGARVITWDSGIGGCDYWDQIPGHPPGPGTCASPSPRNMIAGFYERLRDNPTAPSTTDPAAIRSWAKTSAAWIAANGFDGVLLDIEGVMDHGSAFRSAITEGFCDLRQELEKVIPGALLTLTAADTPFFSGFYGISQPPFGSLDLAAIDKCIDFWQPGIYCTCTGTPYSNATMQIPADTYGRSNAPLPVLENMLRTWGAAGIPPERLSILFPWFNCDFACKDDSCADVVTGPPLQLDPSKGDACGLPAAAFDPTVSLVGPDGGPGYNEVLQLMQKRVSNITHDTARQTKSFVWKDSHGKPHEVSFDDPETLKAKYNWAAAHGFRGVGFWQSDSTGANEEAIAEMWAAVPGKNTTWPLRKSDDPVRL